MYEQIAANKRRTFLLFFLFIVLVMGLGVVFDLAFGLNYLGIVIAFMFTIIWTLISYFAGDKIVLKMSGAREATKQEFAHYVNTVEGLAIAAGIPKPKAYVIEDPAINAFATGRNPENASVAVTTGALHKLNRQELEGVIGHELSHIKNQDIRTMLFAAVLVGVVSIMSRFLLRSFVFGRRRDRNSGGSLAIIAIAVGIVMAILAPLVAQMIKLAISRKREYLADASGAMLTRYPQGLADALKKIKNDKHVVRDASGATAHLYISNPLKKKGLQNLFSTHPPIDERIKILEGM